MTAAAYTARPGTFATLEPVGPDTLVHFGDTLYTDFTMSEVYDPQQFVLTDLDGNRWLLDRAHGLLETTDRNGHTVRFTDDGVFPDTGPSVTFARDSQQRITRVDLADGTHLAYGYDPAGDLVSVTDPRSEVVAFVYDQGDRMTCQGRTPSIARR